MPEMNLTRKVLGWLIAARSGHGHPADYHDRLDMKKKIYTVEGLFFLLQAEISGSEPLINSSDFQLEENNGGGG